MNNEIEELRVICDTTVRLVEVQQRGCAHLCIEAAAVQIMRKLLLTLREHKAATDGGEGSICAE